MSKIKLNKIGNFQLTNNEKQELKGGDVVLVCTCGCCYANDGGSSIQDNTAANTNEHKTTRCATITGWGIEIV